MATQKNSSKPAKAAKKAVAKVAKKAAPKVVRGAVAAAQVSAAASGQALVTACYPVLEPFKFRDTVVKPGAWIELTEAEAAEYQEAGVLGTEAADVPTNADDDDVDSAGGGDGAAAGQGPSASAE